MDVILKKNCLIGMGSIILDNSLINSNIIIGAGQCGIRKFNIRTGIFIRWGTC